MLRILAFPVFVTVLSIAEWGQSVQKSPAFERSDVHVSGPSRFAGFSGGLLPSGRYELRNATILDLINAAYGIEYENIAGGPSWLESDHFDVIAQGPPSTSGKTAALMLQTLLADRFNLVLRNDKKPLAAYVLTAGGNAPKLKPTDASQPAGCQDQSQSSADVTAAGILCHNVTAADIAENLHLVAGDYLDHPVVDSTRLVGSWDIEMKWTRRNGLQAARSAGISVFDAVSKQLGLRLELQTIAMPAVVIDRVDRSPKSNAPGIVQALPPDVFEVADIKPSQPGSQGTHIQILLGGKIDVEGSLRELMNLGWDIPPNISSDLLVGLPRFVDSERFHLVAKAPVFRINGIEQKFPVHMLLAMLRAFITERFKVQSHVESREITVYALQPLRSETKLKASDESERSRCSRDASVTNAGNSVPTIGYKCQNTTMSQLAQNLPLWSASVDHPVIDASGINSGADFAIRWVPRSAAQPVRPADTPNGVFTAADPIGPNVFESIQNALGLKLQTQKGVVKVTVIDYIEQETKEQ